MQQAIERITKSLEGYLNGGIPRSVAAIELVSAFKVVCKNSEIDVSRVETAVEGYINAILSRLDSAELKQGAAVAELTRVYEAAHRGDPNLGDLLNAR